MTLRHSHRQAACNDMMNDMTRATLRRGRSRVVGLAGLAFATLAACSSSPPPPPDAYINATLGPAHDANNDNLCMFGSNSPALTIGVNPGGSTGPTAQPDGSTQPQAGVVNVVCSVTGSFQVSLTAVLAATPLAAGGNLVITGHVDASSGGTVSATIGAGDNGNFSASNCTVTFTYNGGKVPTSPAVAPGRIWGHLSCPTMSSTSGKMVAISTGTASMTEVCDVEADFRFENCAS
jgi:hypothetical protein